MQCRKNGAGGSAILFMVCRPDPSPPPLISHRPAYPRPLHTFPTRRSSDLGRAWSSLIYGRCNAERMVPAEALFFSWCVAPTPLLLLLSHFSPPTLNLLTKYAACSRNPGGVRGVV